MKIYIFPEQIREVFYGKTRIKVVYGEYSAYSLFVPTEKIQEDEGGIFLDLDDNKKTTLKNKGKRLKLTLNELQAVMSGENIDKRPYDVEPVRSSKKRFELLDNNIPAELRELPNWVVYFTTWNDKKHKWNKVLISPTDGEWASSNDSTTWVDYETAKNYAAENDYAGIAFALNGTGITCIDLDHSVNDKGELSELAQRFIKEFGNTYIETSVSGKGLHIFVKDDILQDGKFMNRVKTPQGEIEVYDNLRIISMTGNSRTPVNTLSAADPETKMWLRNALGRRIERKEVSATRFSNSDAEIIRRIRSSRKADEFDALYKGISLTNDHSRDDLKLLNILAFFTDCNAEQMEQIFKSSGLYRPEKKDKYLKLSIDTAISTLTVRMNTEPRRRSYYTRKKSPEKERD
ncbi:MAG: hypothetical protein VZQ61_04665 [Christensenellaceae bacterium]